MFTGRVTRNQFFISILLFSSLLWLALAFPIRHVLGYSWGVLAAGFPIVLIFYSGWAYHFLFRSSLSPRVYIVESLIGIATYTPFTMQPDLLFATADSLTAIQNIPTFFNSTFAVMVLLISFFWASRSASQHTPKVGSSSSSEASWLTLDLDLDEHTYLSPPGMKRLTPLFIAFSALGGALLLLALMDVGEVNSDTQKALIVRTCSMAITIIIYSLLGASLAEALCLIKIEKHQAKGPLRVYDFDERLKWRHDYVKYHLPAPIRKLNLRLFNQHVEAYERLQKQIKSSRT
ncbi:hypothetical protein [Limnobacter alexandrii]|uniref:hypothetical protein n=1 Tax=Limnobacter alexandrii TaxID=2570352 RepID=UPI001107D234|nr:hypothetical protein [Limnobacter alexandrii]